MKPRFAIALSMLAGATIGAAAIQSLHAQATPPVYMIGLVDVADPDGYAREYLPPAQASIKAHGGVTLAAGAGTIIEGTLPKPRVVILRWESMAALKAWRESPEYVAAHEAGLKYAKYNVLAVEGPKQ